MLLYLLPELLDLVQHKSRDILYTVARNSSLLIDFYSESHMSKTEQLP